MDVRLAKARTCVEVILVLIEGGHYRQVKECWFILQSSMASCRDAKADKAMALFYSWFVLEYWECLAVEMRIFLFESRIT